MANPFSRGGVSRKDAKAMGDMLAGGKSSARGSIYSRMSHSPKPGCFPRAALWLWCF